MEKLQDLETQKMDLKAQLDAPEPEEDDDKGKQFRDNAQVLMMLMQNPDYHCVAAEFVASILHDQADRCPKTPERAAMHARASWLNFSDFRGA